MQDWLVSQPDLDLVYALSDTLAVPAIDVAERENQVCTAEADWTANPDCIIFVSVDGIFVDEVVNGRLWRHAALLAAVVRLRVRRCRQRRRRQVATSRRRPILDALLVTPENATCVAEMQGEMAADPASFPFEGSLADIATARDCPVIALD